MKFPLPFVPPQSWHSHPLRFGADRAGGRRKHAGCDLYAPIGTPVYAVADGTVKSFTAFYMGTYALTIDHGEFWIRYGEIAQTIASDFAPGTLIKQGDQIGVVGDLIGLPFSMVHLEMYSGAAAGPLTVPSRAPYMRRPDLLDPTLHLDDWADAIGRPATASAHPTLKLGDRGPSVLAWQRRLLDQGYAVALDSDFGPVTEAATKQFQRASSLTDDGVVGLATYAEMVETEKD